MAWRWGRTSGGWATSANEAGSANEGGTPTQGGQNVRSPRHGCEARRRPNGRSAAGAKTVDDDPVETAPAPESRTRAHGNETVAPSLTSPHPDRSKT